MIIVTDASNKSSICSLLISLKQQEVAFATSINQAYSEYKHSLAFRFRCCCQSKETHLPSANAPNGAQLEGTLYHSPTYIRVRAVLWECGEGQSDKQTHRRQ